MLDPVEGLMPMARLSYGAREPRLTRGIELRPDAIAVDNIPHSNSILPGGLLESAILTARVLRKAAFEFGAHPWAALVEKLGAAGNNDANAADSEGT